jgi:hypothetical protein
MKRMFGGDFKGRSFWIQIQVIAIKMSVCNLHRFLLALFIEDFLKSSFFIFPV